MGYYEDRIASIEARILLYEAAAEDLISGAISVYKLSTGQSEQWVTKLDVFKIEDAIDALISRRIKYERKAKGGGDINAIVGF